MRTFKDLVSSVSNHVEMSEFELHKMTEPYTRINVNLTLNKQNGESVLVPTFLVIFSRIGFGKGGLRISPHVTMSETENLAGIMELKLRLIELRQSGAKAGIQIDGFSCTKKDLTDLMIQFARAYKILLTPINGEFLYITATDLNSRPWMMSTIARWIGEPNCATSKMPIDGGIKGRASATGYGVIHSAKYYLEKIKNQPIKDKRIAIQGFGNVGSWAAHFAEKEGAKVVAITDEFGGIQDEKGINIQNLKNYCAKNEKGTVKGYGEPITNEELFTSDVDIVIPAAIHDQITRYNAKNINAPLVVCGANGPVTHHADEILFSNGIAVIPEIANAGGVVASNFELISSGDPYIITVEQVHDYIRKKLDPNLKDIFDKAEKMNLSYIDSAEIVAVERLLEFYRELGI